MSARIAPDPISPTISLMEHRMPSSKADWRPTLVVAVIPDPPEPKRVNADLLVKPSLAETLPDIAPPEPPPPPPGAVFAAAVLSGALSPRPTSPEELFLRLGSAGNPPGSALQLTDRKA